MVHEIQPAHLIQRYSKPKLKPLERIAIDEIDVGKRQADGDRDLDFFNLKLRALHRSRHAFVG